MRHKKGGRGRSAEESSEDEVIIEDSRIKYVNREEEEEDEDFLESSQDVTQLVPRRKEQARVAERGVSPRKTKDKTMIDGYHGVTTVARPMNGYRVREVNISEMPAHILENMKQLTPKIAEDSDGLTSDDWETAATSDKGGVWILQCPKDVNISELLTGKKLSLEGSTVLKDSNEDSLDLTQFVPNSSLGSNVSNRKFEAVSVANEETKEGVVLLLPGKNNFKIVSAPVQGHIIIRESMEELAVPKIEIQKPKPRKFPKGVKERHPVYGADFTRILQEMEDAPAKRSSKKKKKKYHKADDDESDSHLQNGVGSSSSFLKTSQPPWSSIVDFEEPPQSAKKKKKKKHEESDDYAEISSTQKESLNCFPIVDFSEPYDEPRKKKSKKRKREEMEESFETNDGLLVANDDFQEPVVKKSKKSKSKYRD